MCSTPSLESPKRAAYKLLPFRLSIKKNHHIYLVGGSLDERASLSEALKKKLLLLKPHSFEIHHPESVNWLIEKHKNPIIFILATNDTNNQDANTDIRSQLQDLQIPHQILIPKNTAAKGQLLTTIFLEQAFRALSFVIKKKHSQNFTTSDQNEACEKCSPAFFESKIFKNYKDEIQS